MIEKLRRRMTILVAVVLVLVAAGIVVSINLMNRRNITEQARIALEALSENSGERPSLRRGAQGPLHAEDENSEGTSEEADAGEEAPAGEEPPTDGEEPPERPDGKSGAGGRGLKNHPGMPADTDVIAASLGNSYVVNLSKDGTVENWTSDRADLYTDEQVQDLTNLIEKSGHSFGRIGTQYYTRVSQNGKRMLIILDQRLEIQNAQRVFQVTLVVAAVSCLLLIIGARFLINRMIRPVQEAFEKQRQFVSDASHELKTPLAVIGANADVLEGEIGSSEYLGYIQSEVKRTDRLVRDLLSLARMDKTDAEVPRSMIDLSKTVLEVALPFESSAFEEGRKLQMEVADGVSCYGNADMLAQLTVILLGNALKYSNAGGTITLQVESRGKWSVLRVRNTGEGIAQKDLQKIFDRFYRADASHGRQIEGFGLGLSIAKNIVEAHRGRIKAESVQGKETVFTVELPAHAVR